MANPEHLEILKQGAGAWNQWKQENPKPDLRGAGLLSLILNNMDFSGVDLRGADLSYSECINTNFAFADLTGATLIHTTFRVASFIGTNLSGANFSNSILALANFSDARLTKANFKGAALHRAVFGDNDLSDVEGLENVTHLAPSTIGIDTIYKSSDKIPEVFLRGCGVPEEFITYMHSLVAHPIQFYSCFISYSSKDQDFAERLYSDLQNLGIRCWFAPADLKVGEKFRERIDESIHLHDKLLLILSNSSINSSWVVQEVEVAIQRELSQHRTVLFPIRLDNTALDFNNEWLTLIRNTRQIGDFTDWQDEGNYQKSLSRLVRDLTLNTAAESKNLRRAK